MYLSILITGTQLSPMGPTTQCPNPYLHTETAQRQVILTHPKSLTDLWVTDDVVGFQLDWKIGPKFWAKRQHRRQGTGGQDDTPGAGETWKCLRKSQPTC